MNNQGLPYLLCAHFPGTFFYIFKLFDHCFIHWDWLVSIEDLSNSLTRFIQDIWFVDQPVFISALETQGSEVPLPRPHSIPRRSLCQEVASLFDVIDHAFEPFPLVSHDALVQSSTTLEYLNISQKLFITQNR